MTETRTAATTYEIYIVNLNRFSPRYYTADEVTDFLRRPNVTAENYNIHPSTGGVIVGTDWLTEYAAPTDDGSTGSDGADGDAGEVLTATPARKRITEALRSGSFIALDYGKARLITPTPEMASVTGDLERSEPIRRDVFEALRSHLVSSVEDPRNDYSRIIYTLPTDDSTDVQDHAAPDIVVHETPTRPHLTNKPLTAAQAALVAQLEAGATLECFGVNLWSVRINGRGRRVFAGTCKSLIERGLLAVGGRDHSATIYRLTAA